MKRNEIGFGIFCFGDDYYYKGAVEKIIEINKAGFVCYILTENPDYFVFSDIKIHNRIIPYYRSFKSYHDKMILTKHILLENEICILIDADLIIEDYSFLNDLRYYQFQDGISYVDVLLNHPEKKKQVKELDLFSQEWNDYRYYCDRVYPGYKDLELIWEYFLVIKKNGFNPDFYLHYEKLQIKKEQCNLEMNKKVNGCGEGISIQIASALSNTPIYRDYDLYYDLIRRYVRSESKNFST